MLVGGKKTHKGLWGIWGTEQAIAHAVMEIHGGAGLAGFARRFGYPTDRG